MALTAAYSNSVAAGGSMMLLAVRMMVADSQGPIAHTRLRAVVHAMGQLRAEDRQCDAEGMCMQAGMADLRKFSLTCHLRQILSSAASATNSLPNLCASRLRMTPSSGKSCVHRNRGLSLNQLVGVEAVACNKCQDTAAKAPACCAGAFMGHRRYSRRSYCTAKYMGVNPYLKLETSTTLLFDLPQLLLTAIQRIWLHLNTLRGIDDRGECLQHVWWCVLAFLYHLHTHSKHLCEQLQNVVRLQ